MFRMELGARETLGTQTKCKDDHAYRTLTILRTVNLWKLFSTLFLALERFAVFVCTRITSYTKPFARRYCTTMIEVDIVAAVRSFIGS